jgi:hypothetical protein
MMVKYTYICKGCETPCMVSVHCDENSEMYSRCSDRDWTPKSACSIRVKKGKWDIYSIIPDGII